MQADNLIALLRWFFLFAALFNLAVTTILNRSLVKPIIRRFFELHPARAAVFSHLAFSETIYRICGAIGFGICLLLWWCLGSDTGRALATALLRMLMS
jgi:hypothetical protein